MRNEESHDSDEKTVSQSHANGPVLETGNSSKGEKGYFAGCFPGEC